MQTSGGFQSAKELLPPSNPAPSLLRSAPWETLLWETVGPLLGSTVQVRFNQVEALQGGKAPREQDPLDDATITSLLKLVDAVVSMEPELLFSQLPPTLSAVVLPSDSKLGDLFGLLQNASRNVIQAAVSQLHGATAETIAAKTASFDLERFPPTLGFLVGAGLSWLTGTAGGNVSRLSGLKSASVLARYLDYLGQPSGRLPVV